MGLITVNYSNFRQLHVVTTKCDTLTEEFKSELDTKTLGSLNGPVTLRTDDATRPVKCPRRVPIAMQTKLRYELDVLVDLKVIIPVTEPTEWCSQISVQTKQSGILAICIDPRPLNEVLQRETFPLPTIDDLLPELANGKLFSKVDLSNGYWHCELDEASSLITTFVTTYGRYKWLRLPFGTKGQLGILSAQTTVLETETKYQHNIKTWLNVRSCRVTSSHFKQVCSRQKDNEALGTQLRKSGSIQTKAMRYDIE